MSEPKESPQVTIKFKTKAAAKHFVAWLDGQGEQDYWTWMECREQEEPGQDIKANFTYPNGEKYLKDNAVTELVIETQLEKNQNQ